MLDPPSRFKRVKKGVLTPSLANREFFNFIDFLTRFLQKLILGVCSLLEDDSILLAVAKIAAPDLQRYP